MQPGQIAASDRLVGTIVPTTVAPEAWPHPMAPGFSDAVRSAMARTTATPTEAVSPPAPQIPLTRHSPAAAAVLNAATLVKAAGHKIGMAIMLPQDAPATALSPPAPIADLPAPDLAQGVQTTRPQAAAQPGAERQEDQTGPAPIDEPKAEIMPEGQFAATSLDPPALPHPTVMDFPNPTDTPMLAAVGQQATGDQPEPAAADLWQPAARTAGFQPVSGGTIGSHQQSEHDAALARSDDRSGPVRPPVSVAAATAPAPGPAPVSAPVPAPVSAPVSAFVAAPSPGPAGTSVATPVAAAPVSASPGQQMATAAQPPSAPGSARLAQVAKPVPMAGSAVSPSITHAAASDGIAPVALPEIARQAEPTSQPGAKAADASAAAPSSLPTANAAVLPSAVAAGDAAALPFSPPVVATTPAVVGPDPAAVAPPIRIATAPAALAHDLGLAIARQIAADGNTLHVQIDPAELGRIDVRMTFDDKGILRAIVGADSAISLDLLRRDSADLGRAMTDAGVRADDQSFRFEARSEGRGGEPGQQRPTPRAPMAGNEPTPGDHRDSTHFRPLPWPGRINVLA